MNCQICVGSMDEQAKYDCNHRICMICSVRLAFLYKQPHCPLCKQSTRLISFSFSTANTTQESLTSPRTPTLPQLVYENDDMKKRIENLLLKKCQKCSKTFPTLKQLKKHYLDHGI